MGPINYLGPQEDFLQSIQGGLQIGAGIRQMRDQRAKAEQAQLAQQQYQTDIQAATANPTPQAFAALTLKYPQHREAYKDAWGTLNAAQQQSELSDAALLGAALHSGRPDVAEAKLTERIEALKASGQPTQEAEFLLDRVRTDPKAAYGSLLRVLSAVPGGDKVLENLGKIGTEDRAAAGEARTAAEAPAKLRSAEAGATKAEADAVTAGVTAEFAKPMAIADLKKKAAETGLTQAQTNQAIVTTKKLNAEIQQAAIDAATGDPAKKFDFETKLRKEYTSQIGPVVDTQQAYQRVKASQDNAVGDLSLIFGYMKMLDPGSVVREGEFATAQNAAGVPERVLNAYNRALTGERLGVNQRKQFISQAKDLNDVAERRAKEVRESLMPAISAYKLDKNNIFGDATKAPEPPKPAPAPAPAAEQTATNPKTGERLVLRGGKWVPLK